MSGVVGRGGGGGGGEELVTRYVQPQRLWFLSHFGLKLRIDFIILVQKTENGFGYYKYSVKARFEKVTIKLQILV